MTEKLRKIAKMIISSTNSISIYNKRNYYRHADDINSDLRWLNLGARLRTSMNKVVHNYQ